MQALLYVVDVDAGTPGVKHFRDIATIQSVHRDLRNPFGDQPSPPNTQQPSLHDGKLKVSDGFGSVRGAEPAIGL